MQPSYLLAAGLALTLFLTGCRQQVDSSNAVVSSMIEKEIGPHGGIIAEVGAHAHAEILCSDGGNLDIYFLDEEIKTPVLVDDATIEGFGVASSQGPLPTRLTLTRVNGDEANHFHTRIPSEWAGKRAAVVFPKVLFAGHRWHFDFEVDIPPSLLPTESTSPAANGSGIPAESRTAGTE